MVTGAGRDELALILTGTASRSTNSPGGSSAAAARVWPRKGSPTKVNSSGTAAKLTGPNRWSAAKLSASSSVSRATAAT